MAWQDVLDAIDGVESWVVLLPLYAQIPLLLLVLVPLTWLLARVIDQAVLWMLRRHGDRAGRRAAHGRRSAEDADADAVNSGKES